MSRALELAIRGLGNVEPNPALNDIVPLDGKQGYDVRTVITGIVDRGDFFESQAGFAMNTAPRLRIVVKRIASARKRSGSAQRTESPWEISFPY